MAGSSFASPPNLATRPLPTGRFPSERSRRCPETLSRHYFVARVKGKDPRNCNAICSVPLWFFCTLHWQRNRPETFLSKLLPLLLAREPSDSQSVHPCEDWRSGGTLTSGRSIAEQWYMKTRITLTAIVASVALTSLGQVTPVRPARPAHPLPKIAPPAESTTPPDVPPPQSSASRISGASNSSDATEGADQPTHRRASGYQLFPGTTHQLLPFPAGQTRAARHESYSPATLTLT